MGWTEFFWWFRIKGTVFASIWWQVLLIAAYTAAVVAVSTYVPFLQMNFPQTLITILGVVVSLLLAFRANSAYDR
jgi:putative membrane protein